MTSALLEWDESGGVSGTDAGATVLHGLVSDGEFTEVVANHLGLDFNLGDEKCNGDDNDIRAWYYRIRIVLLLDFRVTLGVKS